MWKAALKWSLLCILLAYVVAMFVWAHAEAKRHIISAIDVSIDGKGNVASITEESVMEVLKGYPQAIVGQQVNAVNTLSVAEFLRKFNSFESVDCMITTQDHLKVRVVPMVPAIRVFDGEQSYYVNKDGKSMASIPGFHVDVPVVRGHFSNNLKPEYVLPVVKFVETDSLLYNLVGMIEVKDARNILLVPKIKGHVINIGDTTRLPEKREAIVTAYRKILPFKGWETYDTISVKFKGQIVATRRDKTPLFPVKVLDDGEDMEGKVLEAFTDSI